MGDDTPKPELINRHQAKTVLDAALEVGRTRWKKQGAGFNEPDFLAGVGAVLDALGQWNAVPPHWFFTILRGESVLSPELQAKYSSERPVYTLTRADVRALLFAHSYPKSKLNDPDFFDAVCETVGEAVSLEDFEDVVRASFRDTDLDWEWNTEGVDE